MNVNIVIRYLCCNAAHLPHHPLATSVSAIVLCICNYRKQIFSLVADQGRPTCRDILNHFFNSRLGWTNVAKWQNLPI